MVSAQAARIQELEDKVRELEAREINVASKCVFLFNPGLSVQYFLHCVLPAFMCLILTSTLSDLPMSTFYLYSYSWFSL